MSQVSDTMRNGAAFYGSAAQSDGGELGFPLPKLAIWEYGAVTTLTTTGICVLATGTTGGGALSATGSLVAGGVATFFCARGVSLTSTANNSTLNFSVVGTDQYGKAQTETIAGPNNNTVTTAKAFKTVTSIISATTIVSTVSAGDSDKLGLPYQLLNKGRLIQPVHQDGVSISTTTVVGFSVTGTSTATTADVRGTVALGTASDGSKLATVCMLVDPSTKETLYGVVPA